MASARRTTTMAVLLTASFMSMLDSTIVNVALGSIAEGLHASAAALEWVVSGYSLAFGMSLITAGRIGDRFGYRRIYVVGLALFTASSLACGLSTSAGMLVAFRVVQGLGAGIFAPAISGSIQHLYTGIERAKAFGAMGTVIGVATASGPVIGGLIIQAFGPVHGWRWVFAVNVPIGVCAIVGAMILLRGGSASRGRSGLDPLGVVALSLGLLLLLAPLVEGQSLGWPWYTWVCLAAAALVLVVFARWEVHQSRRGAEPLVDPRLMRIGSFSVGVVLAVAYFAAFSSVFFVLSLLWQQGLGRSALATGLMIVPWSLGALASATQVFRMVRRWGRRTLLLGCCLVCACLASVVVILGVQGTGVSSWALVAPLFVGGLGNTMFISPNQTFVLARVPGERSASAGAVLQTGQRVGGAIGVAVVGTVFFAVAHARTAADVAAGPAYVAASQWALAVNMLFLLVAIALILILRGRVEGTDPTGAAPVTPPAGRTAREVVADVVGPRQEPGREGT